MSRGKAIRGSGDTTAVNSRYCGARAALQLLTINCTSFACFNPIREIGSTTLVGRRRRAMQTIGVYICRIITYPVIPVKFYILQTTL